MNRDDFKKILAGVSIAGLIAGGTIGCTPKTQEAPPAEQQQEQTAPVSEKEGPAPEGAGGTKAEPAPGG